MPTLETIGGVVAFLIYAGLLYQQNRIMERTNEIMIEQGGAARALANSRGSIGKFWPMITMAALTILTWAALTAWIYIRHNTTNSENVQSNIHTWIDGFNYYGTRTLGPRELSPLYDWDIEATSFDGKRVLHIFRPKTHDAYIGIAEDIPLAPIANQFNGLQQTDKDEIVRLVNIELNRANMAFEWHPGSGVHIETRIPMANLAEENFLPTMERVDNAASAVKETIGLQLERHGITQGVTPPAGP
ncbi:MAG: hypothetical protein WBQ03_14230 [Candidatus Sulfotelmatobacter sp.]